MKSYAVLVKYNELGQAKNIRMNIDAKGMSEVVRAVTPGRGVEWMTYSIDGHTSTTVAVHRIISTHVSVLTSADKKED